jgi:serine/threonine protein kinase
VTFTCPDEDALFALVAGDADPAVRAHTDGCPSCQRKLESMNVGLATLRNLFTHETVTLPTLPTLPESRPAQIGKYFIVGTLGEGAQAVVYRGLHATLNKEVVLKVGRHPVEDGAADRAWLVNEGKLLTLLDHPHLAKVLDLDFHQGWPYLVIEYIPGVNLEEYAGAQKLTPYDSARLVSKLSSALAVAHREGVVHHDVKPTNVLVDETGRPVLIDFGLALLRKAEGRRGEETAPGGTLAYMAPEQARGEVEKIGPASDLFGLGGVLFFLLTGKPPFSGPDGFTIQQKAMRCDLDTSALDRFAIPKPLALLCKKALSASPQDRPASAEAFASELEKLSHPAKRLGWRVVGGVAAGVAGAVGLAAWLWPGPKPLPPAPGAQTLIRLRERTEGGVSRRFERPRLPPYLTNGDLVDVVFETPQDSEPVLFWLGSSGALRQRPPGPAGDGKTGPRLRYPHERQVKVVGPPGTELVLVVASRRGRPVPTQEEMEAILDEVSGGKPLPRLRPDDPPLLVYRGGVEEGIEARDIGEEVSTPLSEMRAWLEALRRKLLERYDWCWGVALPHR